MLINNSSFGLYVRVYSTPMYVSDFVMKSESAVCQWIFAEKSNFLTPHCMTRWGWQVGKLFTKFAKFSFLFSFGPSFSETFGSKKILV